MAPDLVKEFISAFHQEANRQSAEVSTARRAQERELASVNEKIAGLVDAVAAGLRGPSIISSLEVLERRQEELQQVITAAPASTVRLHPNLAEIYRQKVIDLQAALEMPSLHIEAVELIRSLIEKIVFSPTKEGAEIELVGNIALMVELGQSMTLDNKKAARLRAALSVTEISSVKVVAGGRYEPLKQQLRFGRVDRRNADAIADGRVGGRAPALAQDAQRPRLVNDFVDRQEVRRVLQLGH